MAVLSEVKENMVATIKSIDNSCKIKRRLYDIGFLEEENVKCLYIGKSGTPIAFEVRGAVVAIRKCDANMIEVVM